MPKEITHWIMASEALDKLNDNSELKRILKKKVDYYMIGSVSYDAPYSFPGFTTKQKEFRKVADNLHGVNGNDVFLPFKNIIDNQKEKIDESLLAFSVGFLSHVIVDTNFHPLVYYLTGDYYSKDKAKKEKAVSNHRWLETNLDLFLQEKCKEEMRRGQELTGETLKHLDDFLKNVPQLDSVLQEFCRAIPLPNAEQEVENFKKALSYHGFLQKLLFKHSLKVLLATVLGKEHKTVALFYPEKNKFKGEEKITYFHPVTGEERETSIRQLKDSTIEKLSKILQDLDQSLFSGDPQTQVTEFLESLPDRSLETGMYRAEITEMHYFAQDFIRKDWVED